MASRGQSPERGESRVPVSTAELETDPSSGLSSAEALGRLDQFGRNELPAPPRPSPFMLLLRQFREPMAVLLAVAAFVSWLGLNEGFDGIAILSIVLMNAVIGFVQEERAERALEALKSLETRVATLIRDNRTMVVPAADVVPGDLVVLAAGDRVPADLRLTESRTLEVDESMLTGESLPVTKDARSHSARGAGLADQPGTAYSGTLVTRGSGKGIVTATGSQTVIGGIAGGLGEGRPKTPLQLELGRLTARLSAVAVLVAAGVFGLIVMRLGSGIAEIERAFLAAVALAVAAVPEGLATVVTVALALGVRRMAKRGAIVRRLPAVETLGSTTVILTDKTGTLTENRLRLEEIALPDAVRRPATDATPDLVEAALLCNDASRDSGDPIDRALLEAFDADQAEAIRRASPRIGALPFSSERQRMATLHEGSDGASLVVKGAPEAVVELCSKRWVSSNGQTDLGDEERLAVLAVADQMAGEGMRVLALARRHLDEHPASIEDVERELVLLGLVALRDPVRPEAQPSVALAQRAGIRVVMVTGDHPSTAHAVAREVGLDDDLVVTGARLREAGLPRDLPAHQLFARVDPDQKLALVQALRAEGAVVAVTGDGVNDAPALRRADIGVAMGKSGSDVAREASDLVITDDNLATVVTAVQEGRGIYDNIRKVVDYLVAGNLSEITVVVAGLLLFPTLGVPLTPLQLLWVNLLTDGLPAIALAVDPVGAEIMSRPPRSHTERLLGLRRLALLSGRGLLIGASAVGSYAVAFFVWDEPSEHARALMFTVLVAAHLLYAFVARFPSRSRNRLLIAAVAAGIALQGLVVVWPSARPLFDTALLTPREWLLVAAAGTAPVLSMLLWERIRRGGRWKEQAK